MRTNGSYNENKALFDKKLSEDGKKVDYDSDSLSALVQIHYHILKLKKK